MAGKTFTNKIMGRCKYRDGFYITSDVIGGYSYDCEHGFGSSSFVDAKKVVDMADSAGYKVHLAGGRWKDISKKGWGQKVSVSEARKLMAKFAKEYGR